MSPRRSPTASASRSIRLSQAANPPPTTFVDAIDVVFDSTIPYDLRFFQALDRFVQHEPWIERDKAMIDMLKSIGIEKGKPFNPDPSDAGSLERRDQAKRTRGSINRYEASSRHPSTKDSHWVLPGVAGAASKA